MISCRSSVNCELASYMDRSVCPWFAWAFLGLHIKLLNLGSGSLPQQDGASSVAGRGGLALGLQTECRIQTLILTL
jgi:hypothetical protein